MRLYFYLPLPVNVNFKNYLENLPVVKSIGDQQAGGHYVVFGRNEIDIESFMIKVAADFTVPTCRSISPSGNWDLWSICIMNQNDWTYGTKLFRYLGRWVRQNGQNAQNEWRALIPMTEKRFRTLLPLVQMTPNVFFGDDANFASKQNYEPTNAEIDNDVEGVEVTIFNIP